MNDKNPAPISGSTSIDIRILATTDLHMNLLGYDYVRDVSGRSPGFANLASAISTARREAENTILVDGGDAFQGTLVSDRIADGSIDVGLHPMMAAFNALSYDAATIGNHDFNYGLEFLNSLMAQAGFPFLCANVFLAKDQTGNARADRLQHVLPPSTVLEKDVLDRAGKPQVLKIGITGCVPPQITEWDRQVLNGQLVARDGVRATQDQIEQLRGEGCDIVIVVAHMGIGVEHGTNGLENAVLDLARIEGVDAIVAGHTHHVFPSPNFAAPVGVDAIRGTVHGCPVVMAGANASHLGAIDLHIVSTDDGWQVLDHRCAAIPIDADIHPPDPAVLAIASAAHEQTLADGRRIIGEAKGRFQNTFARVANDATLKLAAAAQLAAARTVVLSQDLQSLPLLCAVAPFGNRDQTLGVDIPIGPLTKNQTGSIYPFPNGISLLHITGSVLREWLERSASVFNEVKSGAPPTPLFDPDHPTYYFDVIFGLSVRFDLRSPAKFNSRGQLRDLAAKRVVSITHDGADVSDLDEFILATNSYRANGGGNFPLSPDVRVVGSINRPIGQLIQRHIEGRGAISPETEDSWGFVAMPGARATFRAPAVDMVTTDRDRPFCEDRKIRYLRHLTNEQAEYEIRFP